MNRRKFLSRAASASFPRGAAQAVAQTTGASRGSLALRVELPQSLDTIYGAEKPSPSGWPRSPRQVPDPRIRRGEIVPAFGTVDAVQQGTVECTTRPATTSSQEQDLCVRHDLASA